MSAGFRLVDSGLAEARRNIAMTAALAELHARGRVADTLRLYAFPRSVLIGSGQYIENAVNIAACATRGIEIARRVTGGGAVYMSPGVLAWDLVADRRRLGGRLDAIGAQVGGALAGGLSRLGAEAHFIPPNSIMIAGRKVSGASGFLDGDTAVLQGTVLVEVDLDEMAAVLKAPAPGVDMRTPVTTLALALGAAPPAEAVKKAVIESVETVLRSEFESVEVTVEITGFADRLLAEGLGGIAPSEMRGDGAKIPHIADHRKAAAP